MVPKYEPPRQSIGGQLFDVAFLLALVFGALFLPIWLKIAVPSRVEKLPEGVSYQTAADGTRTWTGLTWEKLGYTKESAAEIITQPFDYSIDTAGILVTALVVVGYFIFMLRISEKEYKQVIAEKFD